MGMPISSYTILQALADKKASPNEYPKSTAHAALAPFRLFAFIIHDRDEHARLNQTIEQRFDHWDYMTGRSLLFFALVDPPKEWLERARHRPYFEHFDSYPTKELLDPKNSIFSDNPSATASAIARQLKIPAEQMPCIVVTPSFEEPRFIWYRTCPDYVEKQLTELGYMAERGKTSYAELRAANIDLCDGSGDNSIEGNLAKALSEVLSFVVSKSSLSSVIRYEGAAQAKALLSRLLDQLQNMRSGNGDVDEEGFDDLNIKIANFLQLLTKSGQATPQVEIDNTLLEKDSYQILLTADRVTEALSREIAGGTGLDMTPALVCLAKVFEREANLSVVHWARKELGVDLPAYYNKVQPHLRAIFPTSNGFSVDLNKKKSGQWLPPGIGQSKITCDDLARARLPREWDHSSWNVLMTNWATIGTKRNDAAHTKLIPASDFESVRQALSNLSTSKVFEKFHRMKTRYSGRI